MKSHSNAGEISANSKNKQMSVLYGNNDILIDMYVQTGKWQYVRAVMSNPHYLV